MSSTVMALLYGVRNTFDEKVGRSNWDLLMIDYEYL